MALSSLAATFPMSPRWTWDGSWTERAALLPTYRTLEERGSAIGTLKADLKAINEALWEIEDKIRDCERAGDFGDAFIALARSVYQTNDRRADVKRSINASAGSRIV